MVARERDERAAVREAGVDRGEELADRIVDERDLAGVRLGVEAHVPGRRGEVLGVRVVEVDEQEEAGRRALEPALHRGGDGRRRALRHAERAPAGLVQVHAVVVHVEAARETELAVEHERGDERGRSEARRLQALGQQRDVRREPIHAVVMDAVLVRLAPGEQRRVRRQGERGGARGAREARAAGGQRVDRGGPIRSGAEGADVVGAQGVDADQHHPLDAGRTRPAAREQERRQHRVRGTEGHSRDSRHVRLRGSLVRNGPDSLVQAASERAKLAVPDLPDRVLCRVPGGPGPESGPPHARSHPVARRAVLPALRLRCADLPDRLDPPVRLRVRHLGARGRDGPRGVHGRARARLVARVPLRGARDAARPRLRDPRGRHRARGDRRAVCDRRIAGALRRGPRRPARSAAVGRHRAGRVLPGVVVRDRARADRADGRDAPAARPPRRPLREPDRLADRRLYAINTAGAVAGTLAAAFWLLPGPRSPRDDRRRGGAERRRARDRRRRRAPRAAGRGRRRRP